MEGLEGKRAPAVPSDYMAPVDQRSLEPGAMGNYWRRRLERHREDATVWQQGG